MRTIVVSDLHGTPAAFELILAHAGFDATRDHLVVAGDFVDGGRHSKRCIEIAESAGATILFGNHDVGLMVDEPVLFRAIERETLPEELLARALAGDWKLTACVDGVIVVHAGFSESFRDAFEREAGGDVERFVEQQNAAFLEEIRRFATLGKTGRLDIWDEDSPVWFRPLWSPPLAGVTQMVGHTSPALYARAQEEVTALEEQGLYLIDSDALYVDSSRPLLRYGVIDSGQPKVVEFRPSEAGA